MSKLSSKKESDLSETIGVPSKAPENVKFNMAPPLEESDSESEEIKQMDKDSDSTVENVEELVDDDLLELLSELKKLQKTTPEEFEQKRVSTAEFKHSRTIILDMDETLIHAMTSNNPDFQYWLTGRVPEKMNPDCLIEMEGY